MIFVMAPGGSARTLSIMMTIDHSQTLSDLTLRVPGAARAFERLGLDYCCGGRRSLAEACVQASVPLEQALRALQEQAQGRPAPVIPSEARELVQYILAHHHVFSRDELERLVPLAEKVARVHGERHPELRQVLGLVYAVRDEFLPHMLKEERVLFPYVEALAAGKVERAPFGTVHNPIRVMEHEHEQLGALLEQLKSETNGYVPPRDACNSYRTLYAGLAELAADIHVHAHLENAVLFPMAASLEEALVR